MSSYTICDNVYNTISDGLFFLVSLWNHGVCFRATEDMVDCFGLNSLATSALPSRKMHSVQILFYLFKKILNLKMFYYKRFNYLMRFFFFCREAAKLWSIKASSSDTDINTAHIN